MKKATSWRERVKPATANPVAQAVRDAAVQAGLLKLFGRVAARRGKRKPTDDRT